MSVDVDALRRAIVNFETDVALDELGALLTELEQLRKAEAARSSVDWKHEAKMAEKELAVADETIRALRVELELRKERDEHRASVEARVTALGELMLDNTDALTSLRRKAQAVVDAWSEHELEAAMVALRDELEGKGGGEMVSAT